MSDEPTPDRLSETAAAPEPAIAAAPPSPRDRRPMLPVLCLLGFVILAAAIVYLYVRPQPVSDIAGTVSDQSAAVAALRADLNALKTRVAVLDGQEKQDAAQWQAAAASTQTQPAPAPAAASAADTSGLTQQVAALSNRLDKLATQQAQASQQTTAAPSTQDLAALSSRVEGLADREAKDGDAMRQDLGDVQKQVAGVVGQVQGLAKDTSSLPNLISRSDRLGQLLRAQEALRAGLPLGAIENAPPALARFETVAPPTEAALRLSFPAAAKRADAAGQPLPDQGRFWHRVWLRVQNLVVVRRGDEVIVGDPTGGVLAHAQRLLDAGDLQGSLTVLDGLSDRAGSAMAGWVAQAKSLVAARQALAQMAAG
jgi:hypothetical protein